MKKIVLALDGNHFPKGAFEMAAWLNQQEPILATGVFLNPVDISKIVAYTGLEAVPLMPEMIDDTYAEKVNENIKRFEEHCIAEGIDFRIHNDAEQLPIASLIRESRFADMILISRDSFFSNISKIQPNEYMQELLKKTECPVLIIPDAFIMPEEILLMYDGEASSVFSIKQFAYLLPEMKQLPVTLMQLVAHGDGAVTEEDAVSELAARHFADLTIEHLQVHDKSVFPALLSGERKTLVVMGAYGRSLFSNLFKKSFADEVIENTTIPLFITHT
ncbi:MAG: hypothetical protein ACO3BD_01245 [Chitinophagaceae bacterium]